MEGYSVTEAASVLGVPTERVWELLARGVLAGAPEGDTGMRVFLQPRPAPAPADPPPTNGDGGGAGRELSPFRELLTEFRNLTERYGQALLALGEARGEVAALRSRVDVLEARMDLRLPGGTAAPSAGWSQPMPRQPEPPDRPEPLPTTTSAEPEPSPASPDPGTGLESERAADGETRTVRRDSARRAIESFAEALARAQDPSIPDLPGGSEAADALAVLRTGTAAEPPGGEVGSEVALPRELPPADAVPVADEVPTVDETPTGDERPAGEEVAARQAVAAEPPTEVEASDDERPASTESTTDGSDPESAAEAGPAWQDEHYTADIGEPDWWEAEALPAARTEPDGPAEADATDATDEPAPGTGQTEADAAATEEAAGQEEPAGAADRTAGPPPETAAEETASRPGSSPSRSPWRTSGTLTRLRPVAPPRADEEETVLWFGRSAEAPAEQDPADTDEVQQESAGSAAATASADSDRRGDALDALDQLSRATPPRASWSERPPAAAADREGRLPDREAGADPFRRPDVTPAGRAYRRLRRIFPG